MEHPWQQRSRMLHRIGASLGPASIACGDQLTSLSIVDVAATSSAFGSRPAHGVDAHMHYGNDSVGTVLNPQVDNSGMSGHDPTAANHRPRLMVGDDRGGSRLQAH